MPCQRFGQLTLRVDAEPHDRLPRFDQGVLRFDVHFGETKARDAAMLPKFDHDKIIPMAHQRPNEFVLVLDRRQFGFFEEAAVLKFRDPLRKVLVDEMLLLVIGEILGDFPVAKDSFHNVHCHFFGGS